MHQLLLSQSIEGGQFTAIAIIFMLCMIAAVGIIAGTARRIARTKAREESRREIAAYVAEGSITADDARKLLDAGDPIDRNDFRSKS